MKNKLNKMLALAGAALLMGFSSTDLQAQNRQGRGDFDPEEMRARMAERVKEQLGVKDDAEWKVIQPRVEKVMEARREVGFGGPGGFGGFGRGPRPGGEDGAPPRRGPGGPGGPGGGRFGGEPSAAVQDLQKALEGDASAEDVKAKLAKVREERKQKEATLAKAREELKQVLSVKQEASAVLMGLLE